MKLALRVRPSFARVYALSITLCVSALLTGCNGFGGSTLTDGGSSSGVSGGTGSSSSGGTGGSTPPAPTYTVAVTVTGLSTTSTGFVIQNGTGNTLPIVANGLTTFPNALAPGTPYNVAVQAQPVTPAQFCRVSDGSGVISDANVTVAINCLTTGRYVFAVNPYDYNGTGSISAFTIDPNTGALTAAAGSPYPTTQLTPTDLSVDPTGQYLYVADYGSATVSTELIGPGGVLTLNASTASTGGANNQPSALALDAAGTYLYVASNDNPQPTIEVYASNGGVLTPANGTLANSIYADGGIAYSLAIDSTGVLLFGADTSTESLFDYAVGAGGALTGFTAYPFQQGAAGAPPNGTAPGPVNVPYAIALYPHAPFLYVTDVNANSVSLYSYDPTGVVTLVAVYADGAGIGMTPTGVTVDPTGSFLYVANSGSGTVSAFTINPTTGVLTPVAGSPVAAGGASPNTATSVRVDPSSQFAYVTNGDHGTISAFAINGATGALTAIGGPVDSAAQSAGPSLLTIE